jgi:hypothetical protein
MSINGNSAIVIPTITNTMPEAALVGPLRATSASWPMPNSIAAMPTDAYVIGSSNRRFNARTASSPSPPCTRFATGTNASESVALMNTLICIASA